jgi:hypothetical protein
MSQEIPQVGDDGNGAQVATDEQQLRAIQAAAARVREASFREAANEEEGVFVSDLDRVKAENLHLKLMVTAYKVKDAQLQLQKYREEQQEYQTEIAQTFADLQQKYNINLTTHEIRASDGAVIPRDQGRLDFSALMQRIAQQAQDAGVE